MRESERKIVSKIFATGNIKSVYEYIIDGETHREYTVDSDGIEYSIITDQNGEFIYCRRN